MQSAGNWFAKAATIDPRSDETDESIRWR